MRDVRPRVPPRRGWPLKVLAVAGAVAVAAVVVTRADDGDEPERPPFRIATPSTTAPQGPRAPVELREPVDPDLQAYTPEGDPPGLASYAWWRKPTTNRAFSWILRPQNWLHVNPYAAPELSSEYLTVANGYRTSWAPPPCECQRLTVWMYGGSTTFGLEQRGDHTIASELARRANRDGLVVDVSNRGQLGQLHWNEAERFAWDLTHEPPPDLVIFYDGVNDVAATSGLYESGDLRTLINPTIASAWEASGRSDGPVPDGPEGARLLEHRAPGGPVDLEPLTIERYNRARLTSASEAAVHGVRAHYFWQPTRYTRPVVLGEPHGDAESENSARLAAQVLRDQLPDDVVDLGDVLDDNTDIIYTDDAHHNEAGATIIADALYANIEADLRAALEEKDHP